MDQVVVNPLTGRRIKIHGALYKKLVKDGVLSHFQGITTALQGLPNPTLLLSESDLYYVCQTVANYCFQGSSVPIEFRHLNIMGSHPAQILQNCFHGFCKVYHPSDLDKEFYPMQAGVYFKFNGTGYVEAHHPTSRFRIKINVPEGKIDSPSLFTPSPMMGDQTNVMNDAMYSTLDTLDEWHELPTWRRFVTHDGYMFDVLFLVKLITDQLNTEKSFNPYPIFPNNPFTREPLSASDLLQLRNQLSRNKIQASQVLRIFLNTEYLWEPAATAIDWRALCIEEFEATLRYVRQFSNIESNHELKLLCYWTPWNAPRAPTEQAVLRYLRTMNHGILTRLYHGPRYTFLPLAYYFRDADIYDRLYTVDRLPI